MIDRRSILLSFLLFVLPGIVAHAVAQQADDNSVRMRGVFQKLDGQSLTIQADDGKRTVLQTAADTLFTHNQPANLSDIKPGDYVASAAVEQSDGKLHSIEVRIFPPELKGLGEGQRPMDDTGKKKMTNAAVTEVGAVADGQSLKVQYKGGTSELVVGPNVPVTAVVVVKASDLQVGAKVFVMAAKQTDGSLHATRVLAQ